MVDRILVIGSSGQIGTELVEELRTIYGNENVIASDIREPQIAQNGPFEILDILNKVQLLEIVEKYNVKEVYLLAALLSATAEKNPSFGWDLNMNSLFNVLNLAKDKVIDKIFWPSSIAVFGPTTPKENTPQYTIMEPSTVYGISKQAGERWCEYYHEKYNVDVRSIRYPGLIGYKSKPGGGTTDYAVDIFHQAILSNNYECFLSENTTLPMMYMSDAIKATINIMKADSSNIKIRSSYNISGMSFSPKEITNRIKKYIPGFSISYKPDDRQKIAESWPKSINDQHAIKDWGWSPDINLSTLTEIMLENLKQLLPLEN
ncbi:MAG: NAD-dependent epimerase [Flavobacteriales bacterium]|nr:MAG: NAD-dependent epimerase [Flavobacteriales bacterium]